MTVCKGRVEVNMPRKRGAGGVLGYDKAMKRFKDGVLQLIVNQVDISKIKCIVIAGPGLMKNQIKAHIAEECIKNQAESKNQEYKMLAQFLKGYHKDQLKDAKTTSKFSSGPKGRLVMAHASSGYRHSLMEVLSDAEVMAMVSDTKASKEVAYLEKFHRMMAQDTGRAFYGPIQVEGAAEQGAIDTLMVTDKLIRSAHSEERRRYAEMMENVANTGGEVLVFSSMHISGEELEQLSGVAAILRFPCPDLEDL